MQSVTVSQLNSYLASVLRGDRNLRGIIVKGEISNFVNYKKSGHFYFTLKEGNSAVKAVMFKNYAEKLPFLPKDGMSVYVTTNVEVFERDGVYQLYASDMLPDGIGALFLAVNETKERLAAEGIFDEEHKKVIPKIPQRIGIVTSREAAALRDMINIIGRRFPAAEILLFPCMVQGKEAPDTIVSALEFADISGCDVIICGRGGGSYEDLMAFNDEGVVRAIYECETPVISAVGHETDTTLADHAADLRAPTPSAAAELAVPILSELLSSLDSLEYSLCFSIKKYIENEEIHLDNLEKQLSFFSPENKIKALESKTELLEKNLKEKMNARISFEENKLTSYAARLDSLSPLKVMKRGYSVVEKDGISVVSADSLKSGDNVRIIFCEGEKNAVIK